MAGKKFTTPDINLLPKAEITNASAGVFLDWALSWGKKIVILTELIVVLAFLSRFYFDTEVANLSEEIDHRKAIIETSRDFEREFRSTTDRVTVALKIADQSSTVTVLKTVKEIIPSSVSLTQINIDENVVNFSGLGNDQSLSQMITNFKDSSKFKDLSLEKIAKAESLGVNFTVKAVYVDQN